MAIYLKEFSTHQEYEQYINGSGAILPNVSICTTEGDVHYTPVQPPHDYSQDYFTMVVTSGGDIKWSGSTTDNTLSYSKDNGENWSAVTSADTISVEAGDKVLWKGTATPKTDKGIGKFSGTTNVRYSVEGNAMSLLFGDNFNGQTSLSGKMCALYGLFAYNTNVTSAENLSLPATTLTQYCYTNMFQNCTSLTTAPELPATTLQIQCYCWMFKGCTSLSSIKCLATNISAINCTYDWVNGVASSGTFTKAASMSSWTTGNDGIPNGWTVVDAA